MRKHSNAEICQLIDDGWFKDGDKLYVVPASLELMKVNDKFGKENGLYNMDSYFEYEGWCDLFVGKNMKQEVWHPERGTKWTINEKCY